MKITITKKEYDNTNNLVYVDPCAEIDCGAIDCNHCPLQETAAALRKAQDDFFKVLREIETVG